MDQNGGPVEYWGVHRIAKRMGCSVNHLMQRLYNDYGFLMYKIPPHGKAYHLGNPTKEFWYTDEGLIKTWQLMQVYEQRQLWKRKPKGVPLEVVKHGKADLQ